MSPQRRPFTIEELRAPVRLPPDEVDPDWYAFGEIFWETKNPDTEPLDVDAHFELERRHRFEYVITRDHVEEDGYDSHSRVGAQRWKGLQAIRKAGRRYLPDTRKTGVVVGCLDVMELPDHVRAAFGEDWHLAMDGFGVAEVGEVADIISNNEDGRYGCTLIGGSLFWFREMHVHPAFRGNHIGAKLLSHALWFLVRNENLAVLEIGHVTGDYDDVKYESTPERVEALARYYQRCGFKRWRTRGWGRNTMYAIGETPLPFESDREWTRYSPDRMKRIRRSLI